MTKGQKISWYRSDGLFAVLLLLAMAIWAFSRPQVPMDEVDGQYTNVCCQPILIRHGEIAFGSERMQFKLSKMKYGLEARLPREIQVGGDLKVFSLPTNESNEAIILFDADIRGFMLKDSARRKYHFVRQ